MAPPLNDSSAVVKREYANTQRLIESCLWNLALIDLFSLCVLDSHVGIGPYACSPPSLDLKL